MKLPIVSSCLKGIGLCLLLLVSSVSLAAESERLRQQLVKSAFLLNLAKMSQWPATLGLLDAPLRLCLYRQDLLGQGYSFIRKKRVNGRVLERRVLEDLTDIASCDLVYLASENLRQFTRENNPEQNLPVLTVVDMTDTKVATRPLAGVHVMLVRKSRRIGFEINLAEARRAGIGFSSELLKLSSIVGGGR